MELCGTVLCALPLQRVPDTIDAVLFDMVADMVPDTICEHLCAWDGHWVWCVVFISAGTLLGAGNGVHFYKSLCNKCLSASICMNETQLG
jgi:hypothetical protein